MMSQEEFNAILNGPLSHPMPMFRLNRLALALRTVIDAVGEEGEKALREVAKEYENRDQFQSGDVYTLFAKEKKL